MCPTSKELHGLTSDECRSHSVLLITLSPKIVQTLDIIVLSFTCCTVLLHNRYGIIKKKLSKLKSPVTWLPYSTLLQIKENVKMLDIILWERVKSIVYGTGKNGIQDLQLWISNGFQIM